MRQLSSSATVHRSSFRQIALRPEHPNGVAQRLGGVAKVGLVMRR